MLFGKKNCIFFKNKTFCMLLFLLFSSQDRVRFPITSQNLVKLCLLFGIVFSINQTNAYRKCWVKFINTHKMVFDLQLELLHLSVWKKSASKMYRNSSTWNYNTIFNSLDASSVLPPLCRWKPKHTKWREKKHVFVANDLWNFYIYQFQ